MFYFSKTKQTINFLGFLFIFLSFFGHISAEGDVSLDELIKMRGSGQLSPTSNFEVRENPFSGGTLWSVYEIGKNESLGNYPTKEAAQYEVNRQNILQELDTAGANLEIRRRIQEDAAKQASMRDQEVVRFNLQTVVDNPGRVQRPEAQRQQNYTNLSGENPLLEGAGGDNLGELFNNLFQWGIGIAIVLAIVMIIFGGIQYMTTDAISNKEEGKGKIRNAVYGLLLALGAWLILNTINPAILNPRLDFGVIGEGVSELVRGDFDSPVRPDDLAPRDYSNYPPVGDGESREFTDEELYQYLLQQVKEAGLENLNPRDAQRFFGTTEPTAEDWADLIMTMSYYESRHDPNLTYREVRQDGTAYRNSKGEQVVSTGLMQLSSESVGGYGFRNLTTEQLKDPRTNLRVATGMIENMVGKYGVIAGGSTEGASRYWSVLREDGTHSGSKVNNIVNDMYSRD